ncbi:MAG: formylglycine-generating enzyme family protein [Planctomycetes bacterium]|nr:formylglycine-generating enzyme family protein [Planctomycetota bacterium]
MAAFDAYHKWLGIPPKHQPPHHYRLLGLELFEDDPDVIDTAANRQMAYLHRCAAGPHAAESQRLLTEIAQARLCLLNGQSKSAYDEKLRNELAAKIAAPVPQPPAPVPQPAAVPPVPPARRVPVETAEHDAASQPVVAPPPVAPVVPAGRPAAESAPTIRPAAPSGARSVRGELLPAATAGTRPRPVRERRSADTAVLIWSAAGGLTVVVLLAIAMFSGGNSSPARSGGNGGNDGAGGGSSQSGGSGNSAAGTITNSIGMKLRLIPAGSFSMGSAASESHAQEQEQPRHTVRLTQPFYMGVYEVTQDEFRRVMDSNPSHFSSSGPGAGKVKAATDRWPVETVSWSEASDFCRRLSDLPEEKAAGRTYRLPTEAEWEYACRAGAGTPWPFGSSAANLDRFARYRDNASGRPGSVGEKQPNAWGLYDMLGNVWEWCSDHYDRDYYAESPSEDPQGPQNGTSRVLRGGSWWDSAEFCRSANRDFYLPTYRDYEVGFRVVCEAKGATESASASGSDSSQKTVVTNTVGMQLRRIEPGEFLMGSSDALPLAQEQERPQHRVRISRPFYIGVYEVTQDQYRRVMRTNPSHFVASGSGASKIRGIATGNFPVETVSWTEAESFCRQLSGLPREAAAGRTYRLPTEAEWEYACRAGSSGTWHFGDSAAVLGEYARFRDNADSRTGDVGQMKPNSRGLYDMYGNVWEWCSDRYDRGYYGWSPLTDPQGQSNGTSRVLRGGSWWDSAEFCRSANRDFYLPTYRDYEVGFRVACDITAP